MAKPRVTAILGTQNKMSPELQHVAKSTRKARAEITRLHGETDKTAKEFKRMGGASARSQREFSRNVQHMNQDVRQLRSRLHSLSMVRSTPKVRVDNQAEKELTGLRKRLKELDGQKVEVAFAGFTGGMVGGALANGGPGFFSQVTANTQAEARRAMNVGAQDMTAFRKQATDFTTINKNVDRATIVDLMTSAERYAKSQDLSRGSASTITKQALQLSAIRPDMGGAEEYQKTIYAMQNAWKEVTDVGRFGDTLADITKNTTDIRGEALDSIIEYSNQVTKFLETPEKLAALMREMNGLWSIDKGFDALKETTLKLYNQGDLENALKTAYEAQGMDGDKASKRAKAESEMVSKKISSGSAADRQYAVGALMQTFGGISDENIRQQLLNEIGAGPGEDLGTKAFAELLRSSGKISKMDSSQFSKQGELDKSYQTYKDNDPLYSFTEAKNTLSNEMLELGIVMGEHLSPVMRELAKGAKWVKEVLESMSTTGAVATVIGGLVAGYIALKTFNTALGMAIRSLLSLSVGKLKRAPEDDYGGGDYDPDRRKRKKKRKWFGGKKKGLPPTLKLVPNTGGALHAESVAKVNKPSLQVVPKTVSHAAEEVPQSIWKKGIEKLSGGASWLGKIGSKVGGSLLNKIPLLGAAYGAADVLSSDDKADAIVRAGGSALGGWGGAAAGAAIGTAILPGIGTAAGGIIGGIAGSSVGEWGAQKLKELWDGWGDKTKDASEGTKAFAASVGSIASSVMEQGSSLIQSLKDAASNASGFFSGAFSSFSATPYANGGMINRPHLGLVGEAGPEAIIPLSAGRRKRALELYTKTGRALGIQPYANGGIPRSTVSGLAVPNSGIVQQINFTIQSQPISIQLNAEGVLQDVQGILKLLKSPAVSNEVKRMVSTMFLDAIETAGGIA